MSNQGPDRPGHVTLIAPAEIRYWTDQFGVSEAVLAEVVREAGSALVAVEAALARRRLRAVPASSADIGAEE